LLEHIERVLHLRLRHSAETSFIVRIYSNISNYDQIYQSRKIDLPVQVQSSTVLQNL
jgi:hypothetical protein